jgi:hypothetical protein
MFTISVSVHQRLSSFNIFLYATTANGVVFLPITLQQFKSLLVAAFRQGSVPIISVLALLALHRAFFMCR